MHLDNLSASERSTLARWWATLAVSEPPFQGGAALGEKGAATMAGRRRRLENRADGARGKPLFMRLSDDEATALAARAEAAGMSRQRYLLTVALSEQGEGAIASRELLADLLRARRIVAGSADNMNQIARHAN
ncbi:plasmid mobilization protein, partial [Aeromicrobium phragmitis]